MATRCWRSDVGKCSRIHPYKPGGAVAYWHPNAIDRSTGVFAGPQRQHRHAPHTPSRCHDSKTKTAPPPGSVVRRRYARKAPGNAAHIYAMPFSTSPTDPPAWALPNWKNRVCGSSAAALTGPRYKSPRAPLRGRRYLYAAHPDLRKGVDVSSSAPPERAERPERVMWARISRPAPRTEARSPPPHRTRSSGPWRTGHPFIDAHTRVHRPSVTCVETSCQVTPLSPVRWMAPEPFRRCIHRLNTPWSGTSDKDGETRRLRA